ncbi:hypothetical protein HAX54_016931 [Datura stramonium]|uniref:Uncharacterized protein n=1 Tax=Datura stramonium TaxID=4076 RepID=A0ABS8S046_DATST|nr:hypothetical protein [Datura stramonium]
MDSPAVQALFEDSSVVPLDSLFSPTTIVVEARFDMFEGEKDIYDRHNFDASTSLLDLSSSFELEEGSMLEGLVLEESADKVDVGDMTKEPSQTSVLLTPRDELIVQSLTHMAQSGSQSKMSEEHAKPSSPIYESTDIHFAPMWDGTPGDLNIEQVVVGSDDSEDKQSLSWKVQRIGSKLQDTQSGDQISQENKAKEKSICRILSSTEIILDQDEEEVEKDIDDDVAISLPVQREKFQEQSSAGEEKKKEGTRLEKSNAEVKRLTGLLAQYDAKIMRLKTALHEASVAPVEKPCLMIVLRQENDAVKAQVGNLTQKLLKSHKAANERMTLLLQKLFGP